MGKKIMILVLFILAAGSAGEASAQSSYDRAVHEGEELDVQRAYFNELISKGGVYELNDAYDSFTRQLKQTEAAIGRISGKTRRDMLNKRYITPAKISKERVIYEISEYRLLYQIGLMDIRNQNSEVTMNLRKLSRLKDRAVQIKHDGGYRGIPAFINRVMNSMEKSLSDGTFVRANRSGKNVMLPFEYDAVLLTNMERVKYDLPPLTIDLALTAVSREKSKDMYAGGYFNHTSPTYGTPFDMMRKFGISYRYAAENIAQGYTDSFSVVEGWMNSEGHRRNILQREYSHIGIGYTSRHWTQMFVGY